MRTISAPAVAGLVTAFSMFLGAAKAAPGDITLVSVRAPGQTTSMYGSYGARLSADGNFLAFFSTSPDLVPQFASAEKNLFVRNLKTGAIEPVRIDPGTSGYNSSDAIDSFSINADGRYVAFTSSASYVVKGDTNGVGDVFVRDRQTGATERVSVSSGGAQGAQVSYAPSISADGRYVAFASRAANLVPGDSNKADDVFVHDRQTGHTERVSVNTAGVQGNGSSFAPAISADGRYVAFTSNATNLVAGDSNAAADIFVHDRQTGTTERVSVGPGGAQANGASAQAAISSDGRYVAFSSDGSNLVTGDTNAATDIFVRDRQAGTTERVSVNSSGQQANGPSIPSYATYWASISGDGRYVAFSSEATNLVPGDTNVAIDVFVHDRLTGQTMLASLSTAGARTNADSAGGSLSADGRYLGFDSYASNLVSGDRNGTVDVYVRDRQASTVVVASTNEVKSTAAGGLDALDDPDYGCDIGTPSISADGRYVAFVSSAPDLVPGQSIPVPEPNTRAHAFVRDRQSAKTVQLAPQSDADRIVMSADASTVATWGNCLGTPQVINRTTGAVEALPPDAYDVALSSSGRFVAFESSASDLVPGDTNGRQDVFVLDRQNHHFERVSVSTAGVQGNNGSFGPSISADGRYVMFVSEATNLVPGGVGNLTEVFVRDRQAGRTERVSTTASGQDANDWSDLATISADGRYVGFTTAASNLVPGDTNGIWDVFVKDRQTGQVERVSVSSNGTQANDYSSRPVFSPDGRYVAFTSYATNLVPNYSGSTAVFIHDRQTGATDGLLVDPKTQGAILPYATYEASFSMSADQRFVAFESNTAFIKTDLNGPALQAVYNKTVGLGLDDYVEERAVSTSALTVLPKSIAFGNQATNTTSAARTVAVTNTGTTAVPITGVALAGANPGQFSFTQNCGTSLAGGAACAVKVKFQPTTKGAKSAVLNVNGGGGGLRSVNLTGAGT